MSNDRKPSPGGNLYVGPSLVASLAGLLASLSAPAAIEPGDVAPAEVVEA